MPSERGDSSKSEEISSLRIHLEFTIRRVCRRTIHLWHVSDHGQYLYIYTTGTSTETRPALNYKTKRPGAAWSAAKFFADGPRDQYDPDQQNTTGEGWDTYPMADEYAPGRFYVAWEFDTSRIKVNKLDISDAP
ncbi:hypothetical protein [Streptomyces dysideae]|uniref:Uncharacterized protein n=1 Tax=Streptomyces dysideae TaxID=909626 RepID=A0A101V375_9ACTN|nr:hypothetical protein [Streptomyces dysideae]KUO21661.1 hypothetical protein AQJ91_07740 [Streptomyces dysideae]